MHVEVDQVVSLSVLILKEVLHSSFYVYVYVNVHSVKGGLGASGTYSTELKYFIGFQVCHWLSNFFSLTSPV